MNYAYVTLATNEEYLYMAAYLQSSLRMVKSKYPLIVMITENLKNHKLLVHFDKYEIIPHYQFKYSKIERYKNTINKFYLYNFVEYDKLCFIDSDIVLFHNIDKYFDLAKDIEFVCPTYAPKRFKTEQYYPLNCVMLLTPQKSSFQMIIEQLNKTTEINFTDDESVVRYLLYPNHFNNKQWDNKCNLFENLENNQQELKYPIFIHSKVWYNKCKYLFFEIEQLDAENMYNYILSLHLRPGMSNEKLHQHFLTIGSLKYYNVRPF